MNFQLIEVTMHKDIDGFTVQHLPIITAYAQKIGMVDVINTLIPTEMSIDAGRVILDTLTGRSPYDILRAYKDQYGIEQNFGFLKNTPIVNSIFLKKAERIEVLALVLLISLLIWRLLEYNMRRYASENGKDLPGWKRRRTNKPTAFMLMTRFQYLLILKIGKHRQIARPLSKIQLEYLNALGLKQNIFTIPGG